MMRTGLLTAVLSGAVLIGCQGAQSAFDPAGVEAERVLNLFWIMLACGTAIWIVVIGAATMPPGASPVRTPTERAFGSSSGAVASFLPWSWQDCFGGVWR